MIASEIGREGESSPAVVPPNERSYIDEDRVYHGVRIREVGRSEQGRPIEVALRGPGPGALRVLVVAGQHGDEPWGRIAAQRWIAAIDHRTIGSVASPPTACLAVLDANPDGSQHGRRGNARERDLNRDHLLLDAPETRAIHEVVRRYSPHLIVDVHNFPPRRRHLLAEGWTIGADVQFAGATHPAIRTSLSAVEEDGLFLRIRSDLAAHGYTAVPYTLFRRSGKARPSTLRVRDARNSLSLRYGIPTLLLEGRDPGRRGSTEEGLRTAAAQLEALRSIEAWASEHRESLLRGPPIPTAGESVPLEARWAEDGESRSVPLGRAGSREVVQVRWARFAGRLRVRSRVSLPRAYAVRNDLAPIHAVLARHGVAGDRVEAPRSALVEPVRSWQASTERIERAWGARSLPAAFPIDLRGYTSYSIHQRAGRALAVWLEGAPRTGLAALRTEREPGRPSERPPILRVVMWDYPPVRAGSARPVPDDRPDRRRAGPSPVPFRWAFGRPMSASGAGGGFGSPVARGRAWEDGALGPSGGRRTDPLG